MAIDRRLLDILCCPVTRQPVAPLTPAQLAVLNAALAAGEVKSADGNTLPAPVTEALITRDGKTVYRVDDGIPVMLADQAIDVSALAGFVHG